MPAAKTVGAIDERAAGPAGQALAEIVDQQAWEQEIIARNPNRKPHPFAAYVDRVLRLSGIGSDAHEVRKMCADVCNIAARLPFVPGDEIVEDEKGREITEFELQIRKTASQAEESLNSEAVWTSAAQKLARTALELRRDKPAEAWIDADHHKQPQAA